MVIAARDVCYLHVDVIDAHREVIGRVSVGAQQDEIIDQLPFEADVAANQVMKRDRSGRDGEANHVRSVGPVRTSAATAGVPVRDPGLLGRVALCLQLLHGAVTAIGAAVSHERLGPLAVAVETVALVDRTLVPVDAQPSQ